MTLQEMRDMIPELECPEGCSDCCGPVYGSKEEMDRLPDKGKALVRAWTHNEYCPYLKNNRCTVYEERPMACRMFGAIKHPEGFLACPHGVTAEYPLQGVLLYKLQTEYFDLMRWSYD